MLIKVKTEQIFIFTFLIIIIVINNNKKICNNNDNMYDGNIT